jgi:hypothetical protein
MSDLPSILNDLCSTLEKVEVNMRLSVCYALTDLVRGQLGAQRKARGAGWNERVSKEATQRREENKAAKMEAQRKARETKLLSQGYEWVTIDGERCLHKPT